MKKNCLLLLLCCFLRSTAPAQTFTATLSGNPVNTTEWTYGTGTIGTGIGGGTSIVGSSVQLNGQVGNAEGYIYYDTAVNLAAKCNEFTVNFDFQIFTPPGGGADGFTFYYITNTPSTFWNTPNPAAPIGSGWPYGEFLNMPSNPDGLVLIFDIYNNNSLTDAPLAKLLGGTGTNFSYYQQGSSTGIIGTEYANQSSLTTTSNSVWNHCKIIYDNGALSVYFNNSSTASITGNYTLDQASYFGFSSSTGGLSSKQSIRNVVITNFIAPPVTDTPVLCQYAGADTISIIGAQPGQTFTWYDASGNQLPGSPTPGTATTGSSLYYVTQQQPGVCVSTYDTVLVTVNPNPAPPVIAGDTAYCINAAQVPFTVTGQSVLWYTADTGGIGATTQPVIPTGTPGTYVYYASQTAGGCTSPRDSVVVDVHPPTPPPTVTPVTLCQYDVDTPITYAATGEGLLWYTNPPTGAGSSVAPTPPTGTPGTTHYYVSQTIEGCQGDSTPVTVTVIHKPTLSFNIADTQICLFGHDMFTYTGNATSSGIYNWILPANDTAISGSGTSTLTAAFNAPGMTQIGFNVTDSGCTSNDTTLLIDVVQSPAPIFNFSPDACINLPDQISYTDPVGDSSDLYYWTFTGASSVTGSGAGPYNVVWDNSGVYNVSLSVVVSSCSSDTTVNAISVHPSPDVHIAPPSSNDICIGDSLQFQASTDTVAVYGYQWMPASDFPVNSMSQVYAIIDTPGYISVRAISNYGCVNTDSVLINTHPCCDIIVPNAFTPNALINNVFRIIGQRPQKIVDFRVFDRWGKVIYNATDDNGWDGTYNGVAQNMGTYYYTISYICADGKEYQKKGDVTLVK